LPLIDLVLSSSHATDSDDPPKCNAYGADFDNMKFLHSTVNWESDMFDLSVDDCWDYFSETFDRASLGQKKCKNICVTKEAVSLKNKRIDCGDAILSLNLMKSCLLLSMLEILYDLRQLRSDFEKRLTGNIKIILNVFGSI